MHQLYNILCIIMPLLVLKVPSNVSICMPLETLRNIRALRYTEKRRECITAKIIALKIKSDHPLAVLACRSVLNMYSTIFSNSKKSRTTGQELER